METRKIQITGKSTYIVSLPKTWVNKVNITNGNSVAMMPRADGTLLINPKINRRDDAPKHHISIETNDVDTMFRKFIGAYLAGFDLIEIKSPDRFRSDMRQKIRILTHNVIGPEIIDEGTSSVQVKDLLDSSDLAPKQVLKRMYVITRGMHRDAVDALQRHDSDLADDVATRDDDVDKFYWLIAKQYNLVLNDMFFAEKMRINVKEILGFVLVARSIERIADHAKKMATNAREITIDHECLNQIAEVSEKILKSFDSAINAFHRNKFEPANEVINDSKQLSDEIDVLKHNMFSIDADAKNVASLAYIIDSLERTRAYVIDIAEVSINHQFATMLDLK
jgi:phosphate uptake regulator